MTLKLKVGDQLPSVGLRATDGYLLNLRSFVTKQPAAFLFFGGPTLKGAAGTRGTKAATALADGHKRLREAGIGVAAISTDSEQQQADFVAAAKLPYLLFSDERRTAVEMLGIDTVAAGSNVNVARPLAIAVDRDGSVRAIIDRIDPATLVDSLIAALSEPIPAAAAGSEPAEPAAGA